MSVLKRPEDIVVEFLRANVSDPRNRYTEDTEIFTATAGQTDFVITPTTNHLIRCIKGVELEGMVLNKWSDYEVDLKAKKVILKNGVTVGDKVEIGFCSSLSGAEWIYPGFPIATMNASKFPRISVVNVNKSGTRTGSYETDLDQTVLLQIDVWTKDGYKPTYSGEVFTEQDLADLLAEQVENSFIEEINDLYPKLYDFFSLAYGQMPFDEESQTYRHKQDISLRGINIGH